MQNYQPSLECEVFCEIVCRSERCRVRGIVVLIDCLLLSFLILRFGQCPFFYECATTHSSPLERAVKPYLECLCHFQKGSPVSLYILYPPEARSPILSPVLLQTIMSVRLSTQPDIDLPLPLPFPPAHLPFQ